MFSNIFQNYAGASASIEIFSMLLWSFLLWVAFSWLVKPTYNEVVAAPVVKKVVSKKSVDTPKDDFQLIEWIGPAIEKLLYQNGVHTYKDICKLDVEWLEGILFIGGSKFKMHSPATWPDQAKLAMNKKWTELEEYQDILNSHKTKK